MRPGSRLRPGEGRACDVAVGPIDVHAWLGRRWADFERSHVDSLLGLSGALAPIQRWNPWPRFLPAMRETSG